MTDMNTQNSWFIPPQIQQHTIRNHKGKGILLKGERFTLPSKLPSEPILILANQDNHLCQSDYQRCSWNCFLFHNIKKRQKYLKSWPDYQVFTNKSTSQPIIACYQILENLWFTVALDLLDLMSISNHIVVV